MDKSPDAFRTISEVSDWLETPAHVLRFWESRFTQLKPVKRAGGRRYYRPGDMALLGGIKKLLHDDGLTIRGVQKILREQGVRYVATLSAPAQAAGDRAADLTLDPADYGTPEVYQHWQDDQSRDSATQPVPEAPMQIDAPEEAAGAELFTLAGDRLLAEQSGDRLLAEQSGDRLLAELSGDRLLADLSPEELADLDLGGLDADDLTIPPDLEEEWAAILAEEATARPPTPAAAADRAPVAEFLAADRQPDLFLEPAPQLTPRRPARDLPPADAEPGPLPVPLASLLRRLVAPATGTGAPLAAALARLDAVRRRRDAATPRQ